MGILSPIRTGDTTPHDSGFIEYKAMTHPHKMNTVVPNFSHIAVLDWILDIPGLSDTQRLYLSYIFGINKGGYLCVSRMARCCRRSVRNVNRVLAVMVRNGILKRIVLSKCKVQYELAITPPSKILNPASNEVKKQEVNPAETNTPKEGNTPVTSITPPLIELSPKVKGKVKDLPTLTAGAAKTCSVDVEQVKAKAEEKLVALHGELPEQDGAWISDKAQELKERMGRARLLTLVNMIVEDYPVYVAKQRAAARRVVYQDELLDAQIVKLQQKTRQIRGEKEPQSYEKSREWAAFPAEDQALEGVFSDDYRTAC